MRYPARRGRSCGGQVQRGIGGGQRCRQVLLAAGIAHQPAELDILDGLRGAVAHLNARERASIAGNLRPANRVAARANRENRERQTARVHGAERGGSDGGRTQHAHVQLRRADWRPMLSSMAWPQALRAGLRQNVFEVLAVALRFQVPGGERAAGTQPVGTVAGEILEEHAIQLTSTSGPPATWVGRITAYRCESERFAGADVKLGDGDRAFAADGDLLRDHAQRDAMDAAGAGVAQRERHVEIEHQGRRRANSSAIAVDMPTRATGGESLPRLILTRPSIDVLRQRGNPAPSRASNATRAYSTSDFIHRDVAVSRTT